MQYATCCLDSANGFCEITQDELQDVSGGFIIALVAIGGTTYTITSGAVAGAIGAAWGLGAVGYQNFFEKIIEQLKQYKKQDMNIMWCSLFDAALYESLLLQKRNEQLDNIINKISEDMIIIEQRLLAEVYLKCFVHLVMYLYKNGQSDMALQLWDKNKDKIPDNTLGRYSVSQINILFGERVDDRLIQKDQIIATSDKLLSDLGLYDDEIQLNQIMMMSRK